MDIALFAYKGPTTPTVRACLESLRYWSNCEIIFYGEVDKPEGLGCEIRRMPCTWDGRRMVSRMLLASKAGIVGDRVLILDVDLLFLADPFRVFDHDFDMCYTTRPVVNLKSPVNGGFSGFRMSSKVAKLWEFLIHQADYPSWPPYQAVRRRLERKDRALELDWWSHQDLLCAMHDRGAPLGCQVYDVGPKYNWCPDSGGGRLLSDTDRANFLKNCRQPGVSVIHFKELKNAVQPGDLVFK